MGTLLTRTVRFFAGTTASTAYELRVAGGLEKVDSPARVFKCMIYNQGDYPVTVTLDGSTDNESWTTRATASLVKAKSDAVLSGAIQGRDAYVRLRVTGSGGETNGQIEIFDESDMFRR